MSETVDWRAMFKRYMDRVIEEEGVDFLYMWDWTETEWAALRELVPELKPWVAP